MTESSLTECCIMESYVKTCHATESSVTDTSVADIGEFCIEFTCSYVTRVKR